MNEMAEHPDEGTIHAWLDDALGAEEAAALEAHVTTCAACAASVAEARGLIAGASRVVSMLDAAPAPIIRNAAAPVEGSLWRALRVTPARAAIAAALIVAVGISLTKDRIAIDQGLPRADSSLVAIAPASPIEAGKENAPPAPQPDTVLRSAIAKRMAKDAPQRSIESSPGLGVPAAAPPVAAGAVAQLNPEPAREVAKARAANQLSELTSGARADKVSAPVAIAPAEGAGCYRIEAADGGASWQGTPLPFDVSLTSTVSSVSAPPPSAATDAVGESRFAILPIGGGDAIGQWSHRAGDSLSVALRGGAPVNVHVVSSSSAFAPRAALRATASARVVARKISCPR